MLQVSTLTFLKNLKKNNAKEWFDRNRKSYQAAKEDFENLIAVVIKELGKKDEDIASLNVKDCVFRINRDIRFSKDKSPYKTNFAASISRGGKKSKFAGYYLHCEPGDNLVGGGLWMPMPDELKTVRQEIDYCFDEFSRIVGNKIFKSTYGGLYTGDDMILTRPPKGYDANNPAISYLRMKSFIAMRSLDDKTITDKNASKKIVEAFIRLQPLVKFINRALED